jgi:hypothetical protein
MNESRDVVFDKPGVVQVLCKLHAYMVAYIVVIEEPHFAIVDGGHFAFKDLAPGRYRLRAWNDLAKQAVTHEIDLKAGPNHTQLELAADDPPKIPDKNGNASADAH